MRSIDINDQHPASEDTGATRVVIGFPFLYSSEVDSSAVRKQVREFENACEAFRQLVYLSRHSKAQLCSHQAHVNVHRIKLRNTGRHVQGVQQSKFWLKAECFEMKACFRLASSCG